jgi:hypothetical protein
MEPRHSGIKLVHTFNGTGRGNVFDESDHNTTAKLVLSSEFSFSGGYPVERALEHIQGRRPVDVIASQNRRSTSSVPLHHLDRTERVIGPENRVVHGEIDRDGRRMGQSFRHQNFTFRTLKK